VRKYIFFFVLCYLFHLTVLAKPPAVKFIENKGQWPGHCGYAADIAGGKLFISPGSFEYIFYDTRALHQRHINGHGESLREKSLYTEDGSNDDYLNLHYLKMNFAGATGRMITPTGSQPTRYNYFYGADPQKWVHNASAFETLSICDLYDGVDLEIYSQGNTMKYDLIIAPEIDPSIVQLEYDGYENLYLENGSLIIKTSVNEVREYRPYVYQLIRGEKAEIPCEYRLEGNKVSFHFPVGYDKNNELIIDPILIFSTYSGSNADNWGNTATFGENGKLYSGGITNHFRGVDANGNPVFLGTFPATTGAYQTTWGGVWDVAILKYDSAGANLEYASYLGGSGSEVPHSLIMNNREELVIYGTTSSTDFPVTAGVYQDSFQGGSVTTTILGTTFSGGTDAFVAILSKDGSQLLSSTYLGGDGNDGISPTVSRLTKNYGDQHRGEVFIDAMDNVYIAGNTNSTDLFTNAGITSFNSSFGGGLTDGFVAKLNHGLTELEWGGYFGGNQSDVALAIKVDNEGNVFAAGGTESLDFNLAHPSYDSSYEGGIDGWIMKIHSDGDSLISGTYLGTDTYDQIYFLDLDSQGDVYVFGQTRGDYPNTTGLSIGNGQFIHKLSSTLEETRFSISFGDNGFEPNISPTAFLVNDCNNLYVSGWGNDGPNFTGDNYVDLSTRGMPTTPDALNRNSNGQDFYLMVLDASASTLLHGTFFGGSQAAIHVDGGTSRFDKSGIVYHSVCASCSGGSSFPTTEDSWSRENGANIGCNNASFKFDLASLRADFETNTVDFDNPGVATACFGDPVVFENRSIGGILYDWNFGDGTELTRQDTTFVVHDYQAPGVYTVILRAFDPNTCIAEDFAFKNVQVVEPDFNVMDDSQLCFGEEIRLSATGAISYTWVSEDSTFTSNERSPVVNPETDTRYFVRLSSGTCTRLDTVDIRVVPEAILDFSFERLYDCWSRPSVKVTNNQPGQDVEFSWSLGDGTVNLEDSYLHEYQRDGDYSIRLTAAREGCLFEETVFVRIQTVEIPNVITPSAPGDNDTFIIHAPDRVKLQIFNRWGRKVYENDNYQDEWAGEELPAGVYYYEADILNETTCKGWVQVIK